MRIPRAMWVVVALLVVLLGMEAEATWVVVKVQYRFYSSEEGRIRASRVNAYGFIEVFGVEGESSQLVLDTDAPGRILIVDRSTGDILRTLVSDFQSRRSCASDASGTEFFCQYFFDILDGQGAASAAGTSKLTIAPRITYNVRLKVQGHLNGVPFDGTFQTGENFVPGTE